MNPEKISKWMDLAKSFAGTDFWSDLFEQPRSHDHEGLKAYTSAKHGGERDAPYPAADVMTTENEIVVLVDLPGADKEDIRLTINDESLYVSGEVKPIYPSGTPVSFERFSGRFERPIRLPTRIDGKTAQIRASFRNGTLIVRIAAAPSWQKNIPIE